MLLSLSRAAHLLGITRAALQARIRDGELAAFDGQVALADLRRLFPDLELDDAGAFEQVRMIKENAFGRRIRERALPSQEILAQRIFHQSAELADLRRHLQQYHALLQTVLDRLGRDDAATLRDVLEQRLAAILAAESDPEHSLAIMHDVLKVVSAQVTVRPSGHEFIAEGNDTLLQAGLKAGLRLAYGCGSGSCGLCKTRVVAGQVRQVAHADYVLSEAERAGGHVLACVCAPVTDVVVETLEAGGPEDIPVQEVVATVRGLQMPTHPGSPALLHLQTPRSRRLRFLAGQDVTLGLATRNGDAASDWPIASCPCDDRNLHFHIAPDPDDPLARVIFAGGLRVGDAVNLRGPSGHFTLDPESPRPLAFLCCGTGFAPVKSLIEHALAIDNTDTFGLVWIADPGAHYLDNQCRMWADAFDRFTYRPLAGDGSAADAARALAEARAALPWLDQADLYIAGPAAFVEGLDDAFRGAPSERRIRRSIV